MSEKTTMIKNLEICKLVLEESAAEHKYHLRYGVETKKEAEEGFIRDAYIIGRIADEMCDADSYDEFTKLYNQLKNEINELPGDEE